ncbi:MAG: hypothetical protein C5B55_01485 [Blastocatellia bacterium]|nr:MAG: hypothetical protein C5B55_01485 [Blastocatellia bacterium]
MQTSGLLDPFPLWTLLPITIAIALISVDAGFRIGRYRRKRTADEPEAPPAGMVGATLGLLAFMLAFTFGLAGSRFETRRQLVLSESNAIRTAYLRAELLAEPTRTNERTMLREYVETRLVGTQPDKIAESIAKSEDLHKRMWSEAATLVEKEKTAITSLFVQSLNQIIELHEQRIVAGLRSRIPSAIWIGLYSLLILAMMAVGYQEAMASKRRSLAVLMLVIGFSTVMVLIADLDRPGQGFLQVSQESMSDVRKSMD